MVFKLSISIKIIVKYTLNYLSELAGYYSSPWPLVLFMKKWSLANRRLRIVWAPKSRGRGPLDKYVINLIIELKTNNPKWGALKISNELAKIGISVCKKTVAKYLEMYGLNSPKNNSKLSWLQFLNSYNFKIAIDFTSIISLSGKQLYILSIINLSTRELLFIMPLIQ